MSKSHYIIPIFVPHKGCPHDCIFCNQKKITGQLEEATAYKAKERIEEHLNTIPNRNAYIEIAFYGGSFTAIPMNQQSELLAVASRYLNNNIIQAIRLSTRPDYINNVILDNLKSYGVSIVELGVQSMNEDVLKFSNRGHTSKDVIKAIKLLQEYKFKVGVQMMIGLPYDNEEKCLCTAKELIDLKPDMARIYPAVVIKNTFMEDMYNRGEYKALSLDEALKISKNILILFEKNNIEVIRIGLQPTDNVEIGRDVVSGPFHPSMRQLVESLIYRDMMENLLTGIDTKGKELCLYVNPKDISDILGQRKCNIEFIKEKYKLDKITVIQDVTIQKNALALKIGEYYDNLTKKVFINNINNSRN